MKTHHKFAGKIVRTKDIQSKNHFGFGEQTNKHTTQSLTHTLLFLDFVPFCEFFLSIFSMFVYKEQQQSCNKDEA